MTGSTSDDLLATAIQNLTADQFENYCVELIKAEGVNVTHVAAGRPSPNTPLHGADCRGEFTIAEPAELLRKETWAFEIRHRRSSKISLEDVRAVAAVPHSPGSGIDVACFVTNSEVTSIVSEFVGRNKVIRMWDRPVLLKLARKHSAISDNFHLNAAAPIATEGISLVITGSANLTVAPATMSASGTFTPPSQKFADELNQIPSGLANFAKYETKVIEILQFLFPNDLGPPKPQATTHDETQRRDILFKNKQQGPLWRRIALKYDSDFLIVDAKNYGDPVEPKVIQDVEKYANSHVGRLILVISRKGAADTVTAAQLRMLRDRHVLAVVLSDDQLIEMVKRKEKGETPEDVIEDAIDALIIIY